MHALTKMFVAAVALVSSACAAFAGMGETKTEVALRAKPAAQAELLLNIPVGAVVSVGHCSRGWCAITWIARRTSARCSSSVASCRPRARPSSGGR